MNNSVLIYSDFNDVVEEAVVLLEKSGYIVSSAGNFNGAIDLITSSDYEYFLVDDSVNATRGLWAFAPQAMSGVGSRISWMRHHFYDGEGALLFLQFMQ